MRKSLVIIIGLFSAMTIAAAKPIRYTFMAPPRQGAATTRAIYGKIARFLAGATGAPIVFHYTSNWLTYMADVQANKADIYFDGPALIGWRIAHWHDQAAVALSGGLEFVLIVKKGGRRLSLAKDLIGRGVCAFSPPNLGTLTLDSWFPNPERQPYIVVIHSFTEAARDIVHGKCMAALEPLPIYRRLTARFPGRLRIASRLPPLPNQGFSISSRVPAALRHKIISALLSPAGRAATRPLRTMFGKKQLVAAKDSTYLPYKKLLGVMVGF